MVTKQYQVTLSDAHSRDAVAALVEVSRGGKTVNFPLGGSSSWLESISEIEGKLFIRAQLDGGQLPVFVFDENLQVYEPETLYFSPDNSSAILILLNARAAPVLFYEKTDSIEMKFLRALDGPIVVKPQECYVEGCNVYLGKAGKGLMCCRMDELV